MRRRTTILIAALLLSGGIASPLAAEAAPLDVPVSTVTLPTVTNEWVCLEAYGDITWSGGSGVDVTLVDSTSTVITYTGLDYGDYRVIADIQDGQTLAQADLPSGWTASELDGGLVLQAQYAATVVQGQCTTTVTLPAVSASTACGAVTGTIAITGGIGVTTTVKDSASAIVSDLGHLAPGNYVVAARVDTGEYLSITALPAGWSATSGAGDDLVSGAAYAVTVVPSVSCPIVTSDRLASGSTLYAGQTLVSASGGYRLIMQSDGNAVVYSATGRVIWASATSTPGSRLVMQVDGNLVVYTPAGRAAFNTGTGRSPGAVLVMQGDGNLVIYAGGRAVYSGYAQQSPRPEPVVPPIPPAPSTYTLAAGSTLASGGQLAYIGFRAIMQTDGNFVVYGPSGPVWSSSTSTAGSTLALGTDGNLVISAPDGTPLWNTRTAGAGVRLIMQSDGNLVLYRGDGSVAWHRLQNTGFRVAPPAPPAPPASQYTLTAGSTLSSGAQLSNVGYRTIMQGDGNLVIYGPSGAVWSSGTSTPGSSLTVQAGGNLVILSPTGTPLWNTATAGSSSRLVMQSDGNLVLYRGDGSVAWYRLQNNGFRIAPPPPPASQYTLPAGSSLVAGTQLVFLEYRAIMQADGNFVVYGPTGALWSTGTSTSGSQLTLQSDGNLVVYGPSAALWSSRTSGAESRLVLQSDGNLVIYRGNGTVAWTRYQNTGGLISAPPVGGGGTATPSNPGNSKNCDDFGTYAQALAWFSTYYPAYGDIALLDADHDGRPCESLPGGPSS